MATSPPEFSSFTADRLIQLSRIEKRHFWFTARNTLVFTILEQERCLPVDRILDLGCGTGKMLASLSYQTGHLYGLDIRPEGLDLSRLHHPSAGLIQGMAEKLPLTDRSFDGILMLDLLEHTDDVEVIREVARILKPSGWVLICVPAFPSLWSYRDVSAGHRRRYLRNELIRLLNQQFQEVHVRYFQFLLFPLLVFTRMLGRNGPALRDLEERPLPVINAFLSWISIAEVRLSRWLNYPWGSSLIAFCRKESHGF
jgi:ubiquinone/menaquinone biosynthesis C-methylase UbiE